jgi:hypothetical protein
MRSSSNQGFPTRQFASGLCQQSNPISSMSSSPRSSRTVLSARRLTAQCADALCYSKWRIVHAYNKSNVQTVPAKTPIPRKDVIIHRMAGAKKLSSLDPIDEYSQVLMELADIPKTAVSTPGGMLWECLVMSHGLPNTPSDLSRLVTHFSIPPCLCADVIYVHITHETGRDLDFFHEKHLRQVLECLEEHNLAAKSKSASLVQTTSVPSGVSLESRAIGPTPKRSRR